MKLRTPYAYPLRRGFFIFIPSTFASSQAEEANDDAP